MGRGRTGCKVFANTAVCAILSARPKQSESAMNAPTDISMKTDEVLRVELEEFRRQHRDLDEAILALEEKGTSDPLTVKRFKQQKLRLKDRISWIEDRLLPDIIA